MSDVIDFTTGLPRPPGPPDSVEPPPSSPGITGVAYALGHALDKATCGCAALRELLLLDDLEDDEFVVRARRNLAFELFEHIGDVEAAWKEARAALWPK
jgi:hypothetical protein